MVVWLLVYFMFVSTVRPVHRWPELDRIPLFDMYQLTQLLFIFLMLRLMSRWLWHSQVKIFRGNILLLAMCLFAIVIASSQVISHFVVLFGQPGVNVWFRFMVFLVLFVSSVHTERELKITVIATIIFCFLVFILDYWSFLQGNVHVGSTTMKERLGSIGPRHGTNTYAAWVLAQLPLIGPLIALCKRYWHYLFVLGYVLLTIRVITLTGSRTGLIGLGGLLVLFLLFSRYRFYWLPIVFLALPVGWATMSVEQQTRYSTIWDSNISGGEYASTERRKEDFMRGFKLMLQYPFGTGAGSGQEMAGGTENQHSLFGQVAGELGIVGFLTFLFMLSCYGINHYNIWRNYKYLQEKNLGKEGLFCWRVSLAMLFGVAAMLLSGLGMGNCYFSTWIYLAAFQIVVVQLMQEKVAAAMQGKLLPGLPTTRSYVNRG